MAILTSSKKQKKVTSKESFVKQADRQNAEVREWITVVILTSLVFIGLLRAGKAGITIYNFLRYLFGDFFWLILVLGIVWQLFAIVSNRKKTDDRGSYIPFVLIILDLLLLFAMFHTNETGLKVITPYFKQIASYFSLESTLKTGGGIIGAVLYGIVSALFSRSGSYVFFIAVLIITTVLMGFIPSYRAAFCYLADFFRLPEKETSYDEETGEVIEKAHPNLWQMREEHKQKKATFIQADKPVNEADLHAIDNKLKQGKEVTIRFTPSEIKETPTSSFMNITVDDAEGDTGNFTLISESGDMTPYDLNPATPITEKEKIFINVDELHDTVKPIPAKIEQTPEKKEIFPSLEDTQDLEVAPAIAEDAKESAQVESMFAKPITQKQTTDYSNYRFPDVRKVLEPIVQTVGKNQNEQIAAKKGEQLIQVLNTFDISATVKGVHIGPSVTQFEVQPDSGVKVSKIVSITDNIKMQLEAKDIRIEAPIPGHNAVGIEIPNDKSTPVKMRELIAQTSLTDNKKQLLFYVGKDLLGQTVTCDIAKMPHMLIAGATGSGKSVCMNSIICSLLLKTHPDDVKMLLIDPKKVEFTPYAKIPHLIGPVINDPAQANNALQVIVRIMDERYDLFSLAGVRNITGYHEKLNKMSVQERQHMAKMPYIVVIIDELADLMITAGKEVEASIQRITQLARAAGIHLIVATQRPSTDVITGVIKANIPSRIAFSVSSGMDSRVILDHVGAERLLGNGDMLYLPIGQNSPTRVQGVFITDAEVEAITQALSPWGPHYEDSFVMLEGVQNGEFTGNNGVSDDPLFQEVKDYVIESRKASTSLLQRRFGIGYNRAARMIDELEMRGIIGPANGSKPREVYAKKENEA